MTTRRPGYKNASVQLPEVAWEALCAEAEGKGTSVAKVLAEILRKHYHIPADRIPKPGRPGRKPKVAGRGTSTEPA